MARSSWRAAGLLEGLHLGERPLGVREPPLQALGHVGETGERVLAPPLRLEPDLLLGAGQAVECLLEPLERGLVGVRGRGPPRRRERVADEDREGEAGEHEDGGERVHRSRVTREQARRGPLGGPPPRAGPHGRLDGSNHPTESPE